MPPWAIKNQLPGATILRQNAPVVIRHKYLINYMILTFAVNFHSGVILLVFTKNTKLKICLFGPYFVICFGNIDIWKLPLFHLELPLVHAKSPRTRRNFEMQIAPGSRRLISRLDFDCVFDMYMYTYICFSNIICDFDVILKLYCVAIQYFAAMTF